MPRKWWVLSAVACGTFMATLDSSIVNIALPTLTKTLDTDLYRIKWVVIIYLLVLTCLLLPFGRLSDQYGRKRVFQFGFFIFIIGSAFCGVSDTLDWLLMSRALQGAGAAMLMANGPAIITAAFPSNSRGKALGILAMVVSAGLVSGPSVGGLLITSLGWRSIFWLNIPVGLLGGLFVHKFVTADPNPTKEGPFDWAGAILQLVVILSFMVAVDPPSISISGSAAHSIPHWAAGLFMLFAGVLFIRVEKEAAAPLFDLELLRDRTFWSANLAGFLTFVSYSALAVLMPFFLEEVLHYPPDRAGLFMTAIPLTIFVVAPVAGRLSDRFGSKELSFIGAMTGALGLFSMGGFFGAGLSASSTIPKIVIGLCAIGLATGLFQSPNNNAIMSVVPPSKLGVASALLGTVRNLGLATGTGLATSLFAWRQSLQSNFVEAFHFTFKVAGLIAVGAMLAALAKKRGRLPDREFPCREGD